MPPTTVYRAFYQPRGPRPATRDPRVSSRVSSHPNHHHDHDHPKAKLPANSATGSSRPLTTSTSSSSSSAPKPVIISQPPLPIRAALVGASAGLGTPVFTVAGVVVIWAKYFANLSPMLRYAIFTMLGGGMLMVKC